MKIVARLTDANDHKSERQYTLRDAMNLIKSFLTSGATIVIESEGGRVELRHEQD